MAEEISSSENQLEGLDFNHQDQLLNAIAQPAQSQPTKLKVKMFKNRVFSLLTLFVDKSKDLTPLIESINQDIFLKQPERIRQLFHSILNKSNLIPEKLKEIADYYKILLLYKLKKNIDKYSEDFVKIIKKLRVIDQQSALNILTEMLEVFLTKRKTKIHANFFCYLLRKLPKLKEIFWKKCTQVESRGSLRPAQQKQIQKLKSKFSNKNGVKEEDLGVQSE